MIVSPGTKRMTPLAALTTLVVLLCVMGPAQTQEHHSQLITRSAEAITATRPANGGPQSDEVSGMEQRLLEEINKIRLFHALAPLESTEDLNRIARGFSFRMNRFGIFGHFDFAGNNVADRVRAAGIRFSLVAENIAKNINFSDPVETAIDGWMKSDGHRANILTSDFRETGVGIWKDGNIYHLTQVFLDPW
jgi:uncharacterized protein YkwD